MARIASGEILEAKRKAIGGARKRCRKGKSCSAACIQGIKVCLVALPSMLNDTLSKVSQKITGAQAEIPEGSYKSRQPEKRFLIGKTALQKAFSNKNEPMLKGRIKELMGALPDTPLKQIGKIGDSQARQNRQFARRLSRNLPKGTSAFLWEGVVNIAAKTSEGDRVLVQYSPKGGFHFTVNGSNDVGTVKTRRGQIAVSFLVRDIYDATVRSLPQGSVLMTRANMRDGKGEKRVSIYGKLGFSLPEVEGGQMYGVVGPRGTVSNSNEMSWKAQSTLPNTVFFSEPLLY